MGLGKTLLLGLIAGITILAGIPLGRVSRPMPTLRQILNALAVGVLVFLIWDVLSAAWEPIDSALTDIHLHHARYGALAGYGALFAGGIAVGLLGLVGYDRWIARRRSTASVVDPARQLAIMIAVGIGLHNFAEGLAIGQSAANGEIALATTLVIGFALHNATEGFGIVAPLAAGVDDGPAKAKPSWAFLLTMALIGGGPTFVGTWVGHGFTSEAVSVAFLSLAAGSIIYVVIQLVAVAVRSRRTDVLCVGLLLGLLAGFVTDGIVTAAGA